MYFRFLHPGTGAIVTKFEVVHEKQFHLFVTSHDMEHFEHIHPVEAPDGTWTIETVLPKAGYYKVLCDFLPSGGSAQFLAQPLVTAGYEGDLEADSAHLVADANPTKTVGDITARVTYDPPAFSNRALRAHDVFPDRHGIRQADHRPADLSRRFRPHADHERGYGGLRSLAPARHSRSARRRWRAAAVSDLIPPGADLEKIRGGPEVTFEGLMPKPGPYRAWTQFRRNDQVRTFAYTFHVSASV